MKKVFACVIMLVLIGVSFGSKTWVSVLDTTEGKPPNVTVVSSDYDTTEIQIFINGFWEEEVTEDNITFKRLSIPSCNVTTPDSAKPEIPLVTFNLGIPPTEAVTCSIVRNLDTTLTSWRVYPRQFPDSLGVSLIFDYDSVFYDQTVEYPSWVIRRTNPILFRDIRVCGVQVSPFKYRPDSDTLWIL